MDAQTLDNNFKYHAPNADTKDYHEEIRHVCKEAAIAINGMVPEGREKATAITKIEEAKMWACAGNVRNS